MPGTSQTRAYLALLLITILWGSYPAITKAAYRDFPPLFLGTARVALAAAFLTWQLFRAGEPATRGLSPAALRAFLVLGICGIVISTQLSYLAIYFTTAANVALLQAATPVLVALGARFHLGERLTRAQWLGVALSAAGVLLIISHGRLGALAPGEIRAGDVINLVGLTGWAAYTVYGKRVLALYSPALATTGAYVLGTLVMIPIAIVTAPLFPAPRLASPIGWFVVLYQAILGGIAHVWWYRAVQTVGPSRSAIFMNVQPIVGVGLAAALLGERVGVVQVLGGICVLAGVAVTTRSQAGRCPA
ncbi:MAG: DMT family transporter [Candidatus Rokubacteria bacterium]|nr:DMT family transporter [Candidatus Rokubacteria bacterium]